MPPDIDPIDYGHMRAEVHALQGQVAELQRKVDQLLEMANQSRGALWVGVGLAGVLSSVVTWIASHVQFRGLP